MLSGILLARRARTPGILALALGALSACQADGVVAPQAAAPDAAPAATPSLALAATATVARPDLPRESVALVQPAATGRTISVASGAALQNAINAAKPGDVIVLRAGTTYTGNFKLPRKSGTGWVTIRTSTPDSRLPAPGQRISPAQAALLPKLATPNTMAAVRAAPGAHHYRLLGVEITAAPGAKAVGALVELGSAAIVQKTLEQVPSHIVIDRSYIHGRSTLNVQRCVELNSKHTAIVNSYLERCHSRLQESQGIAGWNGAGPVLIENNYVEGAGINVMIGGTDPASDRLTPADWTVRRNHLVKPLSWKGTWPTKNLFEVKIGRRILFEDNVLENNWVSAQAGFAVLLKTAVGKRADSWGRTEHVTVRYNVIRNVAAGANVAARPAGRGLPARSIRFEHNVFDGVGKSNGTTNGRIFQLLPGLRDVQIEHNTALHNVDGLGSFVTLGRSAIAGFVFRDNLVSRGSLGLKGDGVAEGTPSLTRLAPGYLFAGNAVVRASATLYPSGNRFPSSVQAVRFVNATAGDYRLSSASPLRGTATDRTDPGADVAEVLRRTAGVVR